MRGKQPYQDWLTLVDILRTNHYAEITAMASTLPAIAKAA
jgi:hypothetical protein